MRNLWTLLVVLLSACSLRETVPESTLFSDITASAGITFSNDLTFTEELNPYTYRNFYNGAGLSIGDINNDGLLDIYFAGNQVDNRLYLNLGDLKFKDITESAGVACTGVWSSGVTMVDINGDGRLDIYVCKSGNPGGERRHNELFVNNGDLTFTERSKEYGLDITGLSVQAAFFDYDKDGDLDCYLLTNSIRSVGNYDLVKDQRKVPDPSGGGNKFFVNRDGKFYDYSEEAGIYRSSIGFGLGITLGDFNDDSWTDIFVSNDFFERDYLYINNQKGGFRESLTEYFQSISMGSMGADLADLDGDGNAELFVTEMLPDSLRRKKTKTVYEGWDRYQLGVQNGYHHQFSRNVLHKKIGDSGYAEVGRLAGVAASEWSWGALIFDMDNDGRKDIFVANGIYKDLLDRDYLAFTGAEDSIRKMIREEKDVIMKLIELMPSSPVPNYAYHNEGDLHFSNKSDAFGLSKRMFSSGSAYGDLDNDGDLDLVINNINEPSIVYRNNTDTSRFKSISISLSSDTGNSDAVGARVTLYVGARVYSADNFVTRGFQSSVQPRIQVGLGKDVDKIDSLFVYWPDGGRSARYDQPTNVFLQIKKEEAEVTSTADKAPGISLLKRLEPDRGYRHQASGLIDFNRDRLLPMMYSNETPHLTTGDIDNDGVVDVYVGGGKDQAGALIRFKNGKVSTVVQEAFEKISLSEETDSHFFDADNDGDNDLYVACGGRFFSKSSSALLDHLLINDGHGSFTEMPGALPFTDFVATSVVRSFDFDQDGDLDLMIGERFHPFSYGLGGRGFLFANDGSGKFNDVTERLAPILKQVGMITSAVVVDFDGDGWKDLVLAGDWMPVKFLRNNHSGFEDVSGSFDVANSNGWWHDLATADLNQDGRPDFVLGNHGLNSFFKQGDRMYVNDYDGNGSIEQIFCTDVGGKYYPIVDKDEFLSQLPGMKKQLLYYKEYSKKSIDDLFDEKLLSRSLVFEVQELSSIALLSGENGYTKVSLPMEAQYSPIYSLLITDMDGDGVLDLIAGGNHYQVKPQFGRYDASRGWLFKGQLTDGTFTFKKGIDLGVDGQIRDIEMVNAFGKKLLIFAKYDSDLEIYEVRN
ncbi:MAG: VCBS repeat-containing protein [Cyclobacteriaceae bacterium]